MTALADRARDGAPPSDAEPPDHRDPQRRLTNLFDPGTLAVLRARDNSGVLAARGRINGTKAIAYCTDATIMGGAMGAEGCRHIVEAIDTASRERSPVIGLWHSGGARLAEGVEALDGVGQVFAAMVRASGRVPQISVVLGAAAGGAAYGPALTDIVIMAPEGRVFVTGPDVVRSVTGEQIDMEALGGPSAHGKKSGVAHVVASSEADALLWARHIASLFARPGMFDLHSIGEEVDFSEYLPAQPQRAYDVRPLLRAILDGPEPGRCDPAGGFAELQPKWAPNIVVGLGRLAGRTIGVVANNPLRLGGCLDSASAEKASRFVRMCDALGVPLLVVVDVPGYLPGVGQEWDGVVRRGAKLLHAFAEAIVPRVTLVTRKAFGGAYIAMNSRSLGATQVFAWPDAQVAVMGAKAAVGILHRKALAAAAEEEREALHAKLAEHHERIAGGVDRAVAIGVVDEVIKPVQTRRRLAEALAAAPAGRGAHSNIPL
jgi:acetyl-CoA/propionyl-CoA carboxylase carboxyl transferase subunit